MQKPDPNKVFFICPVRNENEEIKRENADYVKKLEDAGYEIYCPARDTNQNDLLSGGMRICSDNRRAMIPCGQVHIWYDKSSSGSIFDLGMFFMLLEICDFRKFVIANKDEVRPTPHKSFENVLLALEKDYNRMPKK